MTLLLVESWCDQQCEVIISRLLFFLPSDLKNRKYSSRNGTIRERTVTKILIFSTQFLVSAPVRTSAAVSQQLHHMPSSSYIINLYIF